MSKIYTKKTITIKDIVELCKDGNGKETVSYQVLAMRKTRDMETFPKEINGYYKTVDMINYLTQTGLLKTEVTYIPKNAGSFVIISICGRARTGKDYLAAIFVENPALYRQLFSAPGDDYTQCREIVNIADDNDNSVSIKTNFGQLFKEKFPDNLSDDFYGIALEFRDKKYMLDTEFELFVDELKKFNLLCKRARELELPLDETIITIDMKPSAMASKILDNIGKDWMQLNVYPGESGSVKNGLLSKSDLFILLLRSENKEDAKTIIRIADGIKPHCADAKVLTLFRGSEPIDSFEEYVESEKECINSTKSFEEELNNIQHDKGLLETDLSIVQLEKNILMVPPIKKNANNKDVANKIFTEKLELKVSQLLVSVDYILHIKNIIKDVGKAGIEYAKEILCKFNIELNRNGALISLNGYDRCFSYNHHNLSKYAYDGMNELREKLYNYFNKLLNVNDGWQKGIIVLLYKYLSSQCRDDAGLGIAWHPFEAKPPVCMRTEEAIYAHDVLYYLNKNGANGSSYEKALTSNGIVSNTWNYVSIRYNTDEKKREMERLKLIDTMLGEYNGNSIKETVYIKQVIGTLIYCEFVLFTEALGMNGIDAEKAIKEQMKAKN